MRRINLLPWRDIERAERQKEFITVLGVCVLSAALFLGPVYLVINNIVQNQKERNQYLKEQIALLDEKIRQITKLEELKAQLLARMQVIQQLESDRTFIVRIFDEMVKIVPSGIYLTSLGKEGYIFTLTGISDSNASISQFMRNIENSDLLTKPLLKEINTAGHDGVVNNLFQLAMLQKGVPVTWEASGSNSNNSPIKNKSNTSNEKGK